MKTSETILFFGNERLATGISTDTPVLKALVSNGYNIGGIVIPFSSLKKNSRNERPLEIREFAHIHNIPIIELINLKGSIKELKKTNASVGILASFGKIVPQEIIDLFPYGIINIHPSLLPLHRGPIPIEATILEGETESGVSLMQLVSQMDAGPLFDQIRIKLSGSESKQELANKLGSIGAKRLVDLLPEILKGNLHPKPQTGTATYDKRLERSQALLDYNLPAITLERQIRAFLGWPRTKTIIGSVPVIVTAAHAIYQQTNSVGEFESINGQLTVSTKEGLLVIDRLIPSGSKEMSGSDFILGHPV